MAKPAHQNSEPAPLQLTIVPADAFEDPASAEVPKPANRTPRPVMRRKMHDPMPSAAAPAAAPPKRKRAWTGLLVAGALGGGMVVGGGTVGVLSAVLAALGALGAMVIAVFLWLAAPAVEEPLLVPEEVAVAEEIVEEEAVVEEAAVSNAAAPTVAAVPVAAEPVDEPAAEAASTPPAPAPKAAAAPPPPAPAVEEPAAAAADEALPPAGPITVKIITNPPAARLFIDGRDVGRSPAKLELDPGSYQLTVQSGKASGSFGIDAGLDNDRYCFEARGKKLSMIGCN